jgi:uncharacterized protein YjbI with pentapeptide repeats
MANDKHVAMLKQGVDAWNEWRDENPDIRPDLGGTDLSRADIPGVNLSGANLSETVPDFRQIDNDPYWHRYLLEYDPLSGQVRQRLLNDAVASGDANRVIAFFKGYQREAGRASSSSLPSSQRSRNTAAPSKPTYTRDQIAQLYSAHRKGAYRGREAEWARQEADIIAAGREGRVQGGPYLTK